MDYAKLKYLTEKLWKAVHEKNEGVIEEAANQLYLLVSDFENVALAHGIIQNQNDPVKRSEIAEKIEQNTRIVREMKDLLPSEKVSETLGEATPKEPTAPKATIISNGGVENG